VRAALLTAVLMLACGGGTENPVQVISYDATVKASWSAGPMSATEVKCWATFAGTDGETDQHPLRVPAGECPFRLGRAARVFVATDGADYREVVDVLWGEP
jgi:hypothetical protein